ncbi:MAG: hypothetical protein HY276_02345 [Ignavibacteriales bacterium]|nr:hypothetical protein [Ignavibacteriales bacterium]MBI3787072.1 hypothetical protein [Ignavibacteriales bacterium]
MKTFLLFLFVVTVAGFFARYTDEEGKKGKTISFSKDVKPLINKYCVGCHTAEIDHPSELFADSYEDLMKGGRHGAPILPGKAEESILYQKLKSPTPFGRVMPPSKKIKLTEEQIKIFRDWINQGAKNN